MLTLSLGRAFTAECRLHDEQTARTLHDATIALVERLKRDAVPPERVIVALKTAIAKYGDTHRMPSLIDEPEDLRGEHRAETYQRVFAWCLDAYFENSEESWPRQSDGSAIQAVPLRPTISST